MKIIIHCSDSTFGNAILINQWHKENGWMSKTGISMGYHFDILNGRITSNKYNQIYDGLIEVGRPIDEDNHIETWELGAHTRGRNNSIGICLIGNSGGFTVAQLEALEALLEELRNLYRELDIEQHSHFDKNKPYCAGLDQSFIDRLKYKFS